MDDETRKSFDQLNLMVDRLTAVLEGRFAQMDRQLDAIVVRLDEQDASMDRLMGKVDRLAVLARAGEEAMTSLDALAKRVARLEAARRGDAQ